MMRLNRPLLTVEEEISLAHRIQRGLAARADLEARSATAEQIRADQRVSAGLAARNEMVECNIGLVLKTCKHLAQSKRFDDLVQSGALGLITAAERFDPDRGVRFSSFAVYYIRLETVRFLHEVQMVRQPNYTRRRSSVPAEDLSRQQRLIKLAAIRAGIPVRYFRLSDVDEEDYDRVDEPADERDFNLPSPELPAVIAVAVNALPPLQRDVIVLRFGLNGQTPWTLQQVGDSLQLARERIRQIESAALKRLKATLPPSVCLEVNLCTEAKPRKPRRRTA